MFDRKHIFRAKLYLFNSQIMGYGHFKLGNTYFTVDTIPSNDSYMLRLFVFNIKKRFKPPTGVRYQRNWEFYMDYLWYVDDAVSNCWY